MMSSRPLPGIGTTSSMGGVKPWTRSTSPVTSPIAAMAKTNHRLRWAAQSGPIRKARTPARSVEGSDGAANRLVSADWLSSMMLPPYQRLQDCGPIHQTDGARRAVRDHDLVALHRQEFSQQGQ